MARLPLPDISLAAAYRLRLKRRRALWRALRARHHLRPIVDNTAQIAPETILCIVVLRNEAMRLPQFLAHYRGLGVGHFLVIDNGSDDASRSLLEAAAGEGDLSLWSCEKGYRDSGFGLDWSGWLLMRYGHGHWCLTVDVDELLVYPGMAQHPLPVLTAALEQRGQKAFGALMLDLFAKGPVSAQAYAAGQDPTEVLGWFDPGPYRAQRQAPQGNLWLQGGTRDRVFFADAPERAPTLNKLPLVKWNWRYAYTNSTHALLPRWLNAEYDGPGGDHPCGVLLHTKFLPDAAARAREEQARGQHFHTPSLFQGYYDVLTSGPDLWHPEAVAYRGPEQLAQLGLCSLIEWPT